MSKEYGQETFYATVNGNDYSFYAHTTSTRNGFCHTIWEFHSDITTKVSYINRTWESFCYETALSRAIEKCPKKDQEELKAILIDKTAKEEEERCNAFFNNFKSTYDSLSEKGKKSLENVEIHSEEQAKGVLALMKMEKILEK